AGRARFASALGLPRPAAPPATRTAPLHAALPISDAHHGQGQRIVAAQQRHAIPHLAEQALAVGQTAGGILDAHDVRTTLQNLERSEEHTSELQSRENLVCRLLLEKKKRL